MLPKLLAKLKIQITGVRKHMVCNCPPHWKLVLQTRQHWELSLMSVHCQIGERADLKLVEAHPLLHDFRPNF